MGLCVSACNTVCSSKNEPELIVDPSVKYEKYVPDIRYGIVSSVYDGDTITILGRVKYNPTVYKFSVRLNGIDCPEMRTENVAEKAVALVAKQYVVGAVLNKKVELRNLGLDKYGRLLAHVYIDGRCINDELVEKHMAVKYDGGTKKVPDDWRKYLQEYKEN